MFAHTDANVFFLCVWFTCLYTFFTMRWTHCSSNSTSFLNLFPFFSTISFPVLPNSHWRIYRRLTWQASSSPSISIRLYPTHLNPWAAFYHSADLHDDYFLFFLFFFPPTLGKLEGREFKFLSDKADRNGPTINKSTAILKVPWNQQGFFLVLFRVLPLCCAITLRLMATSWRLSIQLIHILRVVSTVAVWNTKWGQEVVVGWSFLWLLPVLVRIYFLFDSGDMCRLIGLIQLNQLPTATIVDGRVCTVTYLNGRDHPSSKPDSNKRENWLGWLEKISNNGLIYKQSFRVCTPCYFFLRGRGGHSGSCGQNKEATGYWVHFQLLGCSWFA